MKKNRVLITGTKQRVWVAYAQKPELHESFQGKVFKGSIWGEGCMVHDFLLTG